MAQSDYKREEKLQRLQAVKAVYEQVLENKECFSLKDMAVSGSDLIAAGVAPGKEMGIILRKLLEIVIEDPGCNRKEYLLSLLPLQD